MTKYNFQIVTESLPIFFLIQSFFIFANYLCQKFENKISSFLQFFPSSTQFLLYTRPRKNSIIEPNDSSCDK